MASPRAPLTRSQIMARIRGRDTVPELEFRAMLRAHGVRGYRVNVKGLPGTPDVYVAAARTAIFIDGCFWHGHRCQRGSPKTNAEFWRAKVERNAKRDALVSGRLRRMSISVFRLATCDRARWSRVAREVAERCGRGAGADRRAEY